MRRIVTQLSRPQILSYYGKLQLLIESNPDKATITVRDLIEELTSDPKEAFRLRIAFSVLRTIGEKDLDISEIKEVLAWGDERTPEDFELEYKLLPHKQRAANPGHSAYS